MPTTTDAAGPIPSAGFARRLGALVYDLLLLAAALLAATAVVVAVQGGEPVAGGTLWFQVYLLSVVGAYYGWFWTRAGFTPGMRAWRITLRRADGGLPRWSDAMLRLAAAAVSLAPAGLGLLWALIDRERLSVHDRLSRTRIVRDADR